MRTARTTIALALLALACMAASGQPGTVPQGSWATQMRVNASNVCLRAKAAIDSARVTSVDAGRVLEVGTRRGDWVHVRLDGAQTGWIAERFLSPLVETSHGQGSSSSAANRPAAPSGVGPLPNASSQTSQHQVSSANVQAMPIATAPATRPATSALIAPTSVPAATAPATVSTSPPPAAAAQAPAAAATQVTTPATTPPAAPAHPSSPSFLDEAKPDPADRPNDGPATTLGGAFRMMLCLVPVLALIVLGVRGLKMVQQRVGVAPFTKKGLIGGLIEANARHSGGSSIRVVETVPVGGITLHLVEVKGKILLLGATGSAVSMLAEYEPAKPLPEDEFRAIMERARADMFGSEAAGSGGIAGAVGALDDSLRKAREAIARGVGRAKIG